MKTTNLKKMVMTAALFGLSSIGYAQSVGDVCNCDNSDHMRARIVDGKFVQEDKHTINVVTPPPGQKVVSATYLAAASDSDMYDSSMSRDHVKVRTDRHGNLIQSDRHTINIVKPAPADRATLQNGYVMENRTGSDMNTRVLSDGTVVQSDRTTINKFTPSSSTTTTTTDVTTTPSTTTTTDTTVTQTTTVPDNE